MSCLYRPSASGFDTNPYLLTPPQVWAWASDTTWGAAHVPLHEAQEEARAHHLQHQDLPATLNWFILNVFVSLDN